MAASEVVIGVATRTGSAVLVALRGSAARPELAGRAEIDLEPAAAPVQPYHAAAALDLAAAEAMISRAEHGAERAAAAGLRALAGELAVDTAVTGVAVVVKPVTVPASVAAVLRSHAWMHAAEGVLYREAILAAARQCGWTAHAVELASEPAGEPWLAEIGRAAGRPWRRIEKDAARAAIATLK